MKTLPKLLIGASLVTLGACADLGYGENSLDALLEGTPGPVQVAELQGAGLPVVREVPGFEPPIPVVTESVLSPVIPIVTQPVAPPKPKPSVISRVGPPDAKPGQCYAEFVTPAVTESDTKQVLVSAATTKTETIPAKYKTETVRELVTPATTRTETIPATYKTEIRRVPVNADGTVPTGETTTETVTERVLVKPEERRTVTVPAVYETVTERVKIRDSYADWRESDRVYAIGAEALGGTILANRVSSASIMCLVEFPAEYQTVTKRVLVSEETTREEVIPAEYKEVTRSVEVPSDDNADPNAEFKEIEVQVVDTPEQVRVVPVPAEYKTVTKRVLESPAVTRTVPVGPIYRNEVTTRIITPAKRDWVQVLCDKDVTPEYVMQMQKALQARNLYAGPIDGIIGTLTRRAIRKFQGGKSELLSVASARELGLSS